jgi:type I restriction enzyme M protein
MSKQYICDLCKKVFNQKIDFTRHQNKKAPCISLTEMQQIIQTTEEKVDSKNLLTQTFKSCLNVMRDNEGLTGEKALRNLSYLLVLKLIEPHISKEINFENIEYDFSHIDDDLVEKHKNKLLGIIRFSNLSKEKEDNIPVNIKYLWDDILSKHPITKNIFLKEKGFDIQHKSTFKKLIEKLHLLDLSKTEYDVLGNAYEEVIKDVMTGKVLGQFFTQPLVKKIMVRLINPQIFPDGKIESCCDPTMGTGGFLITYLQYILQQARTKKINPDWDFIKNEGIYGKELEPATYQLAISNMLISSGHMFEKLDRGDSIRDPITRKFDNILANPPFGIKGLKYDDFESSLKNQYVPIKSDNAVSLFIQAIIYMLKINGKCAVVLPDGQDLFSKTNTTLVSIREYLMKTCDLKEIIYLPAGIFENTSIKTCIFYFVKKIEGNEILVIKEKTKNKKDYIFSKTHQTTKVRFYDYNESKDEKFLLVEVPIEKIVSNSYSLNYAEYMKDETEEEQYEEGVVVKTLGEVSEIQNGKRIVKSQVENGEYPVLGGGGFTSFYTNEYSREGKTCKISREGMSLHNCVMLLNEKYYLNSQAFTIKSKSENIMINEYLWYYLDNNKELVFKCGRGTAQKAIDIDEFKSIKIPIPSLERQQEIVKYLDFIYEKANKTSNEKIAELKQLNAFCLNNQKIFGENIVKTLGEVCDKIISGKFNSKDSNLVGKYPFYTNKANNPDGFCDNYCFDYDKYFILIKDGGAGNNKYGEHIGLGKIFKVYGKSGGTSHQYALVPKKDYDFEYLYYYLKFIKNEIMDLAHYTTGLGCIKKGDIEGLKIVIPSIERQKEIVEYCEYNDTLIKQLEKEIENNKRFAQKFITGIVKSQINNIVEEQYIENIDETNTEIDSFEEDSFEEDSFEEDIIENDIINEDVIDEPKPIIKKVLIKVKKNNII